MNDRPLIGLSRQIACPLTSQRHWHLADEQSIRRVQCIPLRSIPRQNAPRRFVSTSKQCIQYKWLTKWSLPVEGPAWMGYRILTRLRCQWEKNGHSPGFPHSHHLTSILFTSFCRFIIFYFLFCKIKCIFLVNIHFKFCLNANPH